ncbi:hypothetical protein EVA_12256 [gut metagenome]|uniref:Uncharacterized protein n=1 Tax=gut metagenome TaxID=749906 RepID=J9FXD1_9ZZZZ
MKELFFFQLKLWILLVKIFHFPLIKGIGHIQRISDICQGFHGTDLPQLFQKFQKGLPYLGIRFPSFQLPGQCADFFLYFLKIRS